MTDNIWISAKVGAITLTISGNDPSNFQDNVMAVLGPESTETIGQLFTAAFLNGAETAFQAQAQDAVIAAGMASPTNAASGPASSQEAVTRPQTPAVSSESALREETDKWNNVWTYNVPGAPSCPHGVRVQKKGKSQQGKAYTGWSCPTQSPYAFRNKIQKAECAMEWPSR